MPLTIRMGKHSQKDLIWATFPFNPVTHEMVTDYFKATVAGCRWSGKDKMWTAPLDMAVARDIIAVAHHFQGGVKIEPELGTWAKREKSRVASLLRPDAVFQTFAGMLPRVEREYPRMWKAMLNKPWQIPGAKFIADQRTILLADKPGLGKTIQVLAAIAELDLRGAMLVVAPKTAVAVTWPEEIDRWLGPDENVFVINSDVKPEERKLRVEKAKALAERGERVWILTQPDYLRIKAELDEYGNYLRDEKKHKIIRAVGPTVADLFRMSFSAVIVDESQKVLATKTGSKKRWSAQRLGIGALDLIPGAIRIAMSGTPFRGRTEMIWGTLNWIDPKKYTSYWKWIARHYGVMDEFHAEGETHLVKGDVIKDERRFFSELRPIMVRRTYEELRALGYPIGEKFYGGTPLDPKDPNSPVAVWLPLSVKQAKQYRQLQDDAVITLESLGGDTDELIVNGALAELVRLKQLANAAMGMSSSPDLPSNKIDWVLNFCAERIAAGTKTIVASQFTQFIDVLSRELTRIGVNHYVYTGKTNNKERLRIKTEFQSEDGEMVVLLNTDAGGVSLTLDAADDVVICDQTWIPDDQEQVEHRAFRVSRENHNVTIWVLASLNTIDEDVAKLNVDRETQIFSVIDSQRGVSYVKQLVSATKQRAA